MYIQSKYRLNKLIAININNLFIVYVYYDIIYELNLILFICI